MDIATILRDNLLALFELRKRQGLRPRSPYELEADIGVGKSTVYRITKEGGDNATRIDNLARIAAVFKLQAWQLLVPGFKPEQPPKLLTDKDQLLTDELRLELETLREFRKIVEAQAERLHERLESHSDSVDDGAGPNSRKNQARNSSPYQG